MANSKEMPKIIEEVGFDFDWSNEKVWALDVPVEEMDIKDLEWHFDIPFWNTSNGYYDLTPNQVLTNSQKYKEEFERIRNTDLSYPLDIMYYKNRWLLLDGLHRLVKAKQMGSEKIKVRKIPVGYIPQIKK